MKKESLFWRRAGLVSAVAGLIILMWVGGNPIERSAPVISSDNIVVRLAVAKTGDILQFSDGRRCQVVADRGRDTIEIHYICADDPHTILTTKINDLVSQVEAVFPLVDQAMVFAGLTIRRHSRDGGIPELSRP